MADIEIKCDACSTVLDGNFITTMSGPVLEVEPCETCLEAIRVDIKDTYNEGYDAGVRDGERYVG